MKKLIIIFSVVIILLVGAILLLPSIFKNDIKGIAVEKVNSSINATFKYGGFKLSLIKSFPDFTASFSDISIVGLKPFEKDTLVSVADFSARIDLMSVIRKKGIVIEKIFIDKLNMNFLVNSAGNVNWDIMKPTSVSVYTPNEIADKPLKFKMKSIVIEGLNFVYDNREGNMNFSFFDANATASGDFKGMLTELGIHITTPTLNFDYDSVKYVHNAKIDLSTTLLADLDKFDFKFQTGQSKLNDLPLSVTGGFAMPSDSMFFDIHFEVPGMTMQQVFAMIPEDYGSYVDKVEATGDVSFKGEISGLYYEDIMPLIDIRFNIKNSTIKYPGVPDQIKINEASALIRKPEGDLDLLMLGIEKLNMQMAGNPLSMAATFKSVMTDPMIDLKLNGTIDLGTLTKIFPIDSVTLKGIIAANATFIGNMSDIGSNNFEEFVSSANLKLKDFYFQNTSLPQGLSLVSGTVELKNQDVKVAGLTGKVGKTDFVFDGTLENLLSYMLKKGQLNGNFNLRSNTIDANEFLVSATESTDKEKNETTNKSTAEAQNPSDNSQMIDYLKRAHLRFNASIGKLSYGENLISNVNGNLEFQKENLTLNNLKLQLGKSDFSLTGGLDNVLSYLFSEGELKGQFALTTNFIDANEFMSDEKKPAASNDKNEKKESGQTKGKPFVLPAKTFLTFHANIKKMLYEQMDITNFNGKIELKNQQLTLCGLGMNLLGGTMKMNGTLVADGRQNPDANLTVDLNGFDIQSAYKNLQIVQNYLPFAAKTDGEISAGIKLQTKLGDKLKMVLSALTANGSFTTTNVRLMDAQSFSSLKSVIRMEKVKNYGIDNFTTQFEIKDGNLNLKPFKTAFAGQPVAISGSYNMGGNMKFRLDGTLDRDVLSTDIQNILSKIPGHESITKVDIGLDVTGDVKKPNVKFDGDKIRTQVVDHVKKTGAKEIKDAAKKFLDKYVN